jgi:hypothetical protein
LALLDKLPSPPTSVVETPSDTWDYRPPRSDVLPVFVTKHSPTEPAEVRQTVLAATDVPMCDDDWENWDRVFTARMILTAWFTGELAPVPGTTYDWAVQRDAIEQVWQAFQALRAEEQTARAQALWEAAIYCRGKVTRGGTWCCTCGRGRWRWGRP